MQNFLPKHPFFFTLDTVLKIEKETNKGDVKSMCAKVTKHIKKGGESWSWSELTMNNWLWIVLTVHLYPWIIQPIWCQYQCSRWFHDFSFSCSTDSKSAKSMRPNGNISTEWAKGFSFVWEKVVFYTEVKFY